MKGYNISEVRLMLDEYLQDYKQQLQRLLDIKDKPIGDETLRNMQIKYVANNFDRCVKDILQLSNALCQYQQQNITRSCGDNLSGQVLRQLVSQTQSALSGLNITSKDCMIMFDNLKRLAYYELPAADYKHLYQRKLAQCIEKEKSEQKKAMIRACGLTNPIYQHIFTYDLEGDELYRYPFVCPHSPIDFEQYFLFISLEHEPVDKEMMIEKKSLAPALKDLLRSQNEMIEEGETFKQLMACLSRCNSLFNKEWDEERLKTMMVKLFKSSAAVELDTELKDFKKAKAAVAYVVGRLKKIGVYLPKSDREFAEKLSFENLKTETVARYINQGQNTDVRREYLDWIEDDIQKNK